MGNFNNLVMIFGMVIYIGLYTEVLAAPLVGKGNKNETQQNASSTMNKTETNTNNNTIQFYDEEYDIQDLTMAGDVLMTNDQIEDEVPHSNQQGQQRRRRKRRNFVGPLRPVITWKNGIVPYVFNLGMTNEQKKKIRWAMKIIERRSCIQFKETSFEKRPRYFLAIIAGNSCYSTVGSVNFPLNVLSLKFPNCFSCSTIVHELLHTLGFFHEQQRLDRDKYVKINWDNILPGQQYNFMKVQTPVEAKNEQTYNTRSLMHYKSYDFSSNGKPTIECANGSSSPQCQLGGKWLRKSDVAKLNKAYACPARVHKRRYG